jgi:hypothetical protein
VKVSFKVPMPLHTRLASEALDSAIGTTVYGPDHQRKLGTVVEARVEDEGASAVYVVAVEDEALANLLVRTGEMSFG